MAAFAIGLGTLGALVDVAYAAAAPRTLHRVAAALHHLANESANHTAMIDAGVVAAVKHIALEQVDAAVLEELKRNAGTVEDPFEMLPSDGR